VKPLEVLLPFPPHGGQRRRTGYAIMTSIPIDDGDDDDDDGGGGGEDITTHPPVHQ